MEQKKEQGALAQSGPISLYQKILLVAAAVLIVAGVWYANNPNSELYEPPSADQAGAHASSTPSAPEVSIKTYKSPTHAFQFNYTSDWKQTDLFYLGAYQSAVAFVPAADEAAMRASIKPNSASIIATAEDKAIFVRILNESSINSIVAYLYGNGVVVSNSVINGKNVAHIVHSKSSDPTNWTGGSTEAYIFRNTLGEALVVEANYSSPEPESSGAFKQEFQAVVSSFRLTASK